jgi:hypothetical protein
LRSQSWAFAIILARTMFHGKLLYILETETTRRDDDDDDDNDEPTRDFTQ